MRIRLVVFILLLCVIALQTQAQDTTKAKMADGALIQSTKNTIENLSPAANFSIFINAIQVAGLKNTFNLAIPITVLAPNNKAFEKLPPGRLDTLLKPNHHVELVTLINNHILSGQITSANIAQQIKLNNGTATLTTMAGATLTAKIDANRNIVLTDAAGGQSVISRFDFMQRNGLLHVVTEVLMPANVQ